MKRSLDRSPSRADLAELALELRHEAVALVHALVLVVPARDVHALRAVHLRAEEAEAPEAL